MNATGMPLKKTIAVMVSSDPVRNEVRRFIYTCFQISLLYLQQKSQRSRLDFTFFGMSAEDLAMDCIADLFQRDTVGRFDRLIQYYSRVGWQAMNEEELLETTRRLVFGRVNENLFLRYREEDPSLSRLVRTLKDALKSLPSFTLQRVHGSLWVHFSSDREDAPAIPIMPEEILEAYLVPEIGERTEAREILQSVALIFENQPAYRSSYPLTLLARVIRSATIRLTSSIPAVEPSSIKEEEMRQLIRLSVQEIQGEMRTTYLTKNKLDRNTYDAYFGAIERRLVSEFVEEGQEELTNFKALTLSLENLTREHYERAHRSFMEYLSRLTRKRLAIKLREEI